jgi:DNA-binding transcriptional regulator YhcF (GntR family)
VRIRIDEAGRAPVYAQLRDGIAARIASGRLAPGERIPPVRELAAELRLAPNTVAKAYRELEASGHLVGRGRQGTFVAEDPPERTDDPEAALDDAARAFARRVRKLRVPSDRALDAARKALSRRTP